MEALREAMGLLFCAVSANALYSTLSSKPGGGFPLPAVSVFFPGDLILAAIFVVCIFLRDSEEDARPPDSLEGENEDNLYAFVWSEGFYGQGENREEMGGDMEVEEEDDPLLQKRIENFIAQQYQIMSREEQMPEVSSEMKEMEEEFWKWVREDFMYGYLFDRHVQDI